MKQFIGKNRAENLAWLVNVWLRSGPPVCFLQGFSGVGKTDLARDFRDLAEQAGWKLAVINEVADRATTDFVECLMELSVALSRQGLPEMEQVLFEQAEPNLGYALEKALQRPVVIILDEAQRLFRIDTGSPQNELNRILVHLRHRQDLPGRLLLLSDRIVEEARWSEWIPKRTLSPLEPDEAVLALTTKLDESGVEADLPEERMQEVVRDLDFNPRAIEALVGALRYDTLDEIIESNPGLWAVCDRSVSRGFLKALERDLLERTMQHLDEAHQRKLWRLAVHRRHFRREALEKLCTNAEEADRLRTILVTRYLLNFYKGALSLNPIVREIALSHLREHPAEFQQAHSTAANYHLRHFKARQIVGSEAKLGDSFAELRYHLVQAGREDELAVIGQRFTDHLKREIKSVSPVPTDREELDERIAVLTVLLGAGGAKGLEFYLARCLQARGKPDDLEQAVIHAERARSSDTPEATWYLLATLKYQTGGTDAGLSVIRRAIAEATPPAVMTTLYPLGAEFLVAAQRQADAIALLKEGLTVVPPEKNPFSLYKLCADLLVQRGQPGEAVTLLREGIQAAPPDKDQGSLIQLCADLLAQSGQVDEAIEQLREGIRTIPPEKNLFSLYQFCADLLAQSGQVPQAVELLQQGIEIIPLDKNRTSLYLCYANLLANTGQLTESIRLLLDAIQIVPPEKNLMWLYQSLGEVLCRAGKCDEAIARFREGMGRIPAKYSSYKLAEGALYLCAGAGQSSTLQDILNATGSLALSPQQYQMGRLFQCQMDNDWAGSGHIASLGLQSYPNFLAFYSMSALSHLAQGDAEAAWSALNSFPGLLLRAGEVHVWLATFIHLRRGKPAEAAAMLETYLGRPVDEARELRERYLLCLWDQQEVSYHSNRLCFHFPVLPPAMTGLDRSTLRVQYSPPVLPTVVRQSPGMPLPATSIPPAEATGVSTVLTDVYISYAWGEDSTEAGRQREEIVDRLCEAVQNSGRPIGRDKDRMRGGDSIERFAHEISRARRIVAVISEKSLHSEFCMAQELFRAFRRCDYQRAEFQEKVIAVVLDDAKPLLKDVFAVVSLAKTWRERMERLRSELQMVDPTHRSPHLWVFLDMIEEMCPRLPDMLGALQDVVMTRGLDELVQTGFHDVLQRLPPPPQS